MSNFAVVFLCCVCAGHGTHAQKLFQTLHVPPISECQSSENGADKSQDSAKLLQRRIEVGREIASMPQMEELVSWKNAREECFSLAVPGKKAKLAVKGENEPWPASGVFISNTDEHVASFHVVQSINSGHEPFFSLESCRHSGHYLRHNGGGLIVEPPVAVNDAVWMVGPSTSVDSTCVEFLAGNSILHESLKFTTDEASLSKDKPKCIELRKSKLAPLPSKALQLPSREDCAAGRLSAANRVASMADGAPCQLIPKSTCGALLPGADIGEHGLCLTAGLQRSLKKDLDCLVYGVGIADNWEFEKFMARQGCEVHAFDPTIDRPPSEEPNLPNLYFHKWGLAETSSESGSEVRGTLSGATKTNNPMLTLEDIMEKLGHNHRQVSVLKIDCEGCEWGSLSAVPGHIWDRIDQMSLELHYSDGLMVDSLAQLKKVATVAERIRSHGFVQWRSERRKGWPAHRKFLPELLDGGMPPGYCCRLIGYMKP